MLTAPRLSTALSAVLLAILVLPGCATISPITRDESGEITEAEDSADVFDLTVGDCFDDDGDMVETEDIQSVPTVPCAEEHDFEAYAELVVDEPDFPGQAGIEKLATPFCEDEFASFVGKPFGESELTYTFMWPSEDSWGDVAERTVLCIVAHGQGWKLTDSAQGHGA